MNHPITVECFSDSYATARSRFLETAANLGARIASFPVDNGEALFIDFALIGPSNPEKLVVVSSGMHGVEAFFGSAVQLAFLQKLLNNGNSDLGSDVGVLLIHAINPYGFAMLRRTNEDNIDLNRNFLQPNEEYRGAPVGYSLMNDFINPKSPPPSFDLFLPQALGKILRYGFATVRQAIAEGQYEYPQGLFFGGKSRAKSTEIIQTHLPQWVDSASRIIHLDFHTGLGKRGTYELYPLVWKDLEAYAPLLKQFGSDVTSPPYQPQGLMGTWLSWKLAPKSYICLTPEFGTYPLLKMLAALRAENRVHFYGNLDSDAYKKAKAQLREASCPKADDWRQTVLIHGLNLITKSLTLIHN